MTPDTIPARWEKIAREMVACPGIFPDALPRVHPPNCNGGCRGSGRVPRYPTLLTPCTRLINEYHHAIDMSHLIAVPGGYHLPGDMPCPDCHGSGLVPIAPDLDALMMAALEADIRMVVGMTGGAVVPKDKRFWAWIFGQQSQNGPTSLEAAMSALEARNG